MPRRGAYVTLDGPDGVGKSLQAQRLAQTTESYLTREPGGHINQIRGILLDPLIELTPEAEVLLFSADRNITLRRVIEPTLATGRSVVSDRSYVSTLAYQCYGRGLSLEFAKEATSLALGDKRADKIVILDAPYEVSIARLEKAGKVAAHDRFEMEGKHFHERVRNGFLELVRDIGERALLIDASGTEDEVMFQLFENCLHLLKDGVLEETA